tara:strand:- start:5005 stop:5583 length:579 start_codon:yes stop_codon:yes gene_type:complete
MAYLDESDTSDLDHINTINECYDNIDEDETTLNTETHKILNSMNINIQQQPVPDKRIIKQLVSQYVKYEEQLVLLNSKKKEIQTQIDTIKKSLVPFMEAQNIDFITIDTSEIDSYLPSANNTTPSTSTTTTTSKIKYSKVKRYKSFSKKYFINIFEAYFKNEDDAKKLLKFIYDNREYKEIPQIKKDKSKKQ